MILSLIKLKTSFQDALIFPEIVICAIPTTKKKIHTTHNPSKTILKT